MKTCETCGHQMSNDWANMVNQCPNCGAEVYRDKSKEETK